MATKAHERLAKIAGSDANLDAVEKSFIYSRQLGNSYTASIFIGLASLLEQTQEDLSQKRIGFFSYGSGCVAEFFSGIVQPGYKAHLHTAHHAEMLASRTKATISEYESFFSHRLPEDGSHYQTSLYHTGRYRLTGIKNHERLYELA